MNRKRAWRTDGGTAIFGGAAIFLATVNTACNFVAVKEDGIDWLQHLLYCSILWQTWLGWWWWVGSGMGIGEVEVSGLPRRSGVLRRCRMNKRLTDRI